MANPVLNRDYKLSFHTKCKGIPLITGIISKAYKCEICKAIMKSIENLEKHLKTKHNKKSIDQEYSYVYICKFCRKQYKRHHFLSLHILRRHDAVKYVKSFLSNCDRYDILNIKSHLQINCTKCDEKFTSDEINRTLLSTGSNNYPCPKCSSTFKYWISLYDHTVRFHNDQK